MERRGRFAQHVRFSNRIRRRRRQPHSISLTHRAGTVPEFCSSAIPSNRAVHKRPKFTAKAQSSPSPRTRKKAFGADPPIVNKKLGDCPRVFSSVVDSLLSIPPIRIQAICSWGVFRKTLDVPNRQCNFSVRYAVAFSPSSDNFRCS